MVFALCYLDLLVWSKAYNHIEEVILQVTSGAMLQ